MSSLPLASRHRSNRTDSERVQPAWPDAALVAVVAVLAIAVVLRFARGDGSMTEAAIAVSILACSGQTYLSSWRISAVLKRRSRRRSGEEGGPL